MNQRGMALLTALWLMAALSAVAAASLSLARVGSDTTRNRLILDRAEWAREACGEILAGRYAEHGKVIALDTVDLGGGVWCRATVEDAGARLDLNRAAPNLLRTLLADDSLADALLDWRDPDGQSRPLGAEAAWYRQQGRRTPRDGPLADLDELRLIRGFDSSRVARLGRVLTVLGATRVDINTAPPELLAALPGLGPAAVSFILGRRAAGRSVRDIDELIAWLPASARPGLLASYADLTAIASFAPENFVAHLEGGVTPFPLVSRGTLFLVPAAQRLAVIRREFE